MEQVLTSNGSHEVRQLGVETARSRLLKVVGAYVAVRVGLLVLDLIAAHRSFNGNLDGPMEAWDSWHYIHIAQHGYPTLAPMIAGQLTFSDGAFGPVYPALIAVLSFPLRSTVLAALAVSIIGGLVSTICVWRIAAHVKTEKVALRSALMFMLLPGMAIVWGTLYSECVGVAFASLSLLLMIEKKWLAAGIAGALAALASPIAIVLVAAPVARSFANFRRRKEVLPPWIAAVTIPIGLLSFIAWLAHRYRDPLFWWHLQRQGWGTQVDYGRSLLKLLPHWSRIGGQGPAWVQWIGIALVVAGIAAMILARLPLELNMYTICVFVVLFSTSNLGFKPRLLVWAFPAVIAMASSYPRWARRTTLAVFAALLPIFFVLYTTMGNSIAQP